MRYDNIHPAVFIERLNRFVARVAIDGAEERVHVKNTGRCAELLVPGARVWLVRSAAGGRKTAYDLVAAVKCRGEETVLVNMDSMAPNAAAKEWIEAGGLGRIEALRGESIIGDSRFDFTGIQDGRRVVIEVKGCTLERNGIALFPDAPTLRGVKHVKGLTELARQGCRCIVLIVIQMKGVKEFRPNWETHPEFGHALKLAQEAGVEIVSVDCRICPGVVQIDGRIPVVLT